MAPMAGIRVRALEILGKIYGAFAPEKSEVTTYCGAFLADLDLNEAQFEALPEEKGSGISVTYTDRPLPSQGKGRLSSLGSTV